MKQVVIRKGQPIVIDIPAPSLRRGTIEVELRMSCVSPGTEIAGIAASGKSLLQRAIEKPEKVREVLSGMKRSGIRSVVNKVQTQMSQELLVGYSAAGVVTDVGEGAGGFTKGMRVAVAGAGFASHAEKVVVPVNLATSIPSNVSDAEASTVALGAIALHAVRRSGASIGDRVAVIGCGPLGVLAIQMLRASGCNVFAADLDVRRLDKAACAGAQCVGNPKEEDIVNRALDWSNGIGVDSVILFTSTSSPDPLSQACQMSRQKGKVILAGIAGSIYNREDFYAKEIDLLISTSYGPGRYDAKYEIEGEDYPIAYVRWTEKRNMESYLELIDSSRVDVNSLVELRMNVDRAADVYAALSSDAKPMLAVLEYPSASTGSVDSDSGSADPVPRGIARTDSRGSHGSSFNLGLIGTGSFVRGVHAPILRAMSSCFSVSWVSARTGTSAREVAGLFNGCRIGTDLNEVLLDSAVDALLIGTRHDSHAEIAVRGLKAEKSVFLEKPMCLNPGELGAIKAALASTSGAFLVGYNRRFSPFANCIREAAAGRVQPMVISYRVNAGRLAASHWTQGPEGGGRLMGEACHMIDLFRSLVGCAAVEIKCTPLQDNKKNLLSTDNYVLTISYSDGSIASLLYTSMGHRSVAKESMEVFFDGKTFLMDDYLVLKEYGVRFKENKLKVQDKGHSGEWKVFHRALMEGERFPIPWAELEETWRISWQADQICRGFL